MSELQAHNEKRKDYFKFTDEQWRAIARRDFLTFPRSDEPPLEAGQVIVLEAATSLAFTDDELRAKPELGANSSVESKVLWLTVTELRRTRKFLWRILYRLEDHRPLWLRSGPPQADKSRLKRTHWTPVEEHGLTGESYSAFDREAEIVGAYQNVIDLRGKVKDLERKRREDPDKEAERDIQRVQAEVRDLVKRAVKMGVDPMLALAPVARAIEEQHEEIKDAA